MRPHRIRYIAGRRYRIPRRFFREEWKRQGRPPHPRHSLAIDFGLHLLPYEHKDNERYRRMNDATTSQSERFSSIIYFIYAKSRVVDLVLRPSAFSKLLGPSTEQGAVMPVPMVIR